MPKINTIATVSVPKLSDKLVGTSVGGAPINQTNNFTLQQLKTLFEGGSPPSSPNLQSVLNAGNTATQSIFLTGTMQATNIAIANNTTSKNLYLSERLFDKNNAQGTSGQYLTSTGTGVQWSTLTIAIPTLQQVLTAGNVSDKNIITTGNIQAANLQSANLTANSNLRVVGTLSDSSNASGTSGQLLSSTVVGTSWIDLPSYSAVSPLIYNNTLKQFSIQQATGTQNGYLSSADWITFDGKQNSGNYITALTGEATASGPGSASITLNTLAVINKTLTGFTTLSGTVTSADSIVTAFGKLQNQINGVASGLNYQGAWNASANIPTLISGVGTNGEYYVVDVAGTTNLNGISDWKVGDWAIFNGTSWQKIDNTDSVVSVNGQIGVVVLNSDNIAEGSTNLYYTDARSRSAISSLATGLTYASGTGVFSLSSGYSIPTIANQTDWTTAYNNSIVSAAVTGTTTKTLTLTQQDGGTITTNWTDFDTGLTSVGLSMPSAFSVANSPLTYNGTIAVTGAGTAAQYIRGDGQLAPFPSTAGGGSSINYYFNGSVPSGVVGYQQMANSAVIGTGTNFSLTGNGLIAEFLTDAGNPNRLIIPGGAWNLELYFSVNSGGGNQKFYVDLLKYDGVTFTLIASGITNPEEITGGTTTDLYLTSLAVPETTLLATDRLAMRVYIVDNAVGRTVTLHTEDNTLCEIITTFAGGISALNGLTDNTQYFAVGTTGTDFNINSLLDTHTFNLPTASATNRGALSTADWATFNSKQNTITLTTTGSSGPATLIGDTLNIPDYVTDLSGYVTLGTDQTVTGLKTILRGGDVLNFKIGTDTLYGLKVAYNQNELVPSGEATWSFVNTFNREGNGYEVTPLSFFRGILVTGERLISSSVNTNLLDYYGNNPTGRYPIYAYNTGVQQFASSIIVGETAGVVNAATGTIADLPSGVVANFKGRAIGSDAINTNEFATLGQLASSSIMTSDSGYCSTIRSGVNNIALGFYSIAGGGQFNVVSSYNGVISGGQYNTLTGGNSVIVGGSNNSVSGYYSGVISGYDNIVNNCNSFAIGSCITTNRNSTTFVNDLTIVSAAACSGSGVCIGTNGLLVPYTLGGGGIMIAGTGTCSTIRCGVGNTAGGACSASLSGCSNTASGLASFVGGGRGNISSGSASVVVGGGGFFGTINTSCGNGSFVGAGTGNLAGGTFSAISGGMCNTASGSYSSIGGGRSNQVGGTASTIGGGFNNFTTFMSSTGNCATVSGGNLNIAVGNLSTIGGGYGNTASGACSFIGGGYCNTANGCFSTISGGFNNTASSYYSTVVGGLQNSVSGSRSFIGGGIFNTASSYYSGILGGANNSIPSPYIHSFIIGSNITATQTCTTFVNDLSICSFNSCSGCSVCIGTNGLLTASSGGGGGGIMILGTGSCSTIRDGVFNSASDSYSAALGGQFNQAIGYASVISGGLANSACCIYTTVGGGTGNTASAYFATVGGGQSNTASGSYSGAYLQNIGTPTIAGGKQNTASNRYTFVGGGWFNTACGPFSLVGGGAFNTSSSYHSIIVGGNNNTSSAYYSTIVGGWQNTASGSRSFIGGGRGNTASAYYSGILGGAYNTVSHYGSFIIGTNLTSSASNTTYVNALSKTSGTFRINHPDPAKTATHYLQHSFVESPTRGDNIYRYKITTSNCHATLALPEYYKFLNEDDQVFVTPKGHFGSAYGVIDSCQNSVNFVSNADGEYNVLIIGTRKDIDAKNGFDGIEILKKF